MEPGTNSPSPALGGAVPQIPAEYDDLYMQQGSFTNQRDFSHDINRRMKMPNRLSVDGQNLHDLEVENMRAQSNSSHAAAALMAVPDKITITGSGNRGALDDQFGFMNTVGPENRDYVNITTPPRVLTVDERFPVIDDEQEMPVTPSKNTVDVSVIEARPDQLELSTGSTQLVSASRNAERVLLERIQNLEQREQQRRTKEMVLYPFLAVYFTYKLFKWVTGR